MGIPSEKLENLITIMEETYIDVSYYAHMIGVLDDDAIERLNILQHKMSRMTHIYKETIDEW